MRGSIRRGRSKRKGAERERRIGHGDGVDSEARTGQPLADYI
jgi:hypothetical protein